MTDNVLKTIGYTTSGKPVLGGAFQLADTLGVPLWLSLDQAKEKNCVISIAHYFASAMEHGWDDKQTFDKIREAFVDADRIDEVEIIREKCIKMFMEFASKHPNCTAAEVGKKMREVIESS